MPKLQWKKPFRGRIGGRTTVARSGHQSEPFL